LDVKNVVNIQADEPLIKPQMIDSLISALIHDKSIYMATLAKRITNPEELTNPNVVKVVKDKADFALYFSRSPIPYLRNQSGDVASTKFFKHIGLYAYTKDFLFTFKTLPKSSLEKAEQLEQLRVLENNYKIKIIETEFDTIGVDTPEDLLKVEMILGGS
jgi:3-deoxy-manno-octulosonate cytidylyltransferase (CMP-KDO synthetase)